MQKIAISKNGLCLSASYQNNVTKLKWKCEEGHEWLATPKHVKSGTWCPICKKNGTFYLREAQKYAKSRGGQCLSQKYINSNSKLLWKCAKGHDFDASLRYLRYHNRWCSKCNGIKQYSIQDMNEFAISKGGKCLSSSYKNGRIKLLWKCSAKHQWYARPEHIISGNSWCPKCSKKKKHSIEEVQFLAKEKKGKCLSKKYKNALNKLKWQCKKGHVWEASLNYIKNGNGWCPICNDINHYSIEDMKHHAKINDGRCISQKYINSNTKLKWECSNKHIW